MAEGKNRVVIYADWQDSFEALSDEEAGQLIKHFFKYINDENPILENRVLRVAWIPIEKTLKRDLRKWLEKSNKNRENALMRWHPNASERINRNANHADSDSDSDSDSDIDIKKISISEIKISDVEEKNKIYFKIATEFYQMLRGRILEIDGNVELFDKKPAKIWLDQFRLAFEKDGWKREQFLEVYKFLQKDTFWIPNIQSPGKLRSQMSQLYTKAKMPAASKNKEASINPSDYIPNARTPDE